LPPELDHASASAWLAGPAARRGQARLKALPAGDGCAASAVPSGPRSGAALARRRAQVVGVVPTGWTFQMKKAAYPVRSKGAAHIHLVPYSEHSSFAELQEYVRFMRPVQARSQPLP